MNKIEQQKENMVKLLELVKENPDLRILPMVEYEVCGGDDFACWAGAFGKAEIEDVWLDETGERGHFMSDDFDDLVEYKKDNFSDEEVAGMTDDEIDALAVQKVDALPWEKVIVVRITTP